MQDSDELSLRDQFRGCLLGGALGDALGATVEFAGIDQIRSRFGPNGVRQLEAPGRFTDDTQMTLFTCEGLIRYMVRGREKGIASPVATVYHAYLRWLLTQGSGRDVVERVFGEEQADGWLIDHELLHHRRAPGNTCLSALESGTEGSVTDPINDSKGCGAVIRAAPVGFFTPESIVAFEAGCETGAITHGHPSGYLPAGVLACVVWELLHGSELVDAVSVAYGFLEGRPGAGETMRAIDAARELARRGLPSPEEIERSLGSGWVGEEALAIGLCCALSDESGEDKLCAAVNHSGDSDSTGSICGNLIGAQHGTAVLPAAWIEVLEGSQIIEELATDHVVELTDPPVDADGSVTADWWAKYPGW